MNHRYAVGQYWCYECNAVHDIQYSSTEDIMKTGWRSIDQTYFNIGSCTGMHRESEQPISVT